ncbi:MAG: DUF1697 domain-containing protein [Paludibacter sp.]
MKTWISILRGINVGGRNAVKMDALRNLYVDLGFSDVQSYIQSGNVIFKSDSIDSQLIKILISAEIKKSFGIEVYVSVIDMEKFRNILKNNPFRGDTTKDPAFLHITFLSEKPDKTLIDKISSRNYAHDEFYIGEKVIYLYCPSGYGNTKLNNTFFETKLKLTATTRNLKTSNELLAMAEKL